VCSSDLDFVLKLIPRIVAEEWSARKIEQYIVNAKRGGATNDDAPARLPDQEFEARIATLKKKLNTDVAIRMNSKGAGRIVINFKDQAEFERLQQLLDR
jgi:hypothetical protein